MQSASASLKQPLMFIETSLSIPKTLEGNATSSPRSSSINKKFRKTFKSRVAIPFSKETFSSILSYKALQRQKRSAEEEHIKATNCLSTIEDPLWKLVCRDVINMMGPASFLKIWGSKLGEACFQNQSMDIHCQTKEVAQFIQQYDFVILESLHPYFPALKQLRIRTTQNCFGPQC